MGLAFEASVPEEGDECLKPRFFCGLSRGNSTVGQLLERRCLLGQSLAHTCMLLQLEGGETAVLEFLERIKNKTSIPKRACCNALQTAFIWQLAAGKVFHHTYSRASKSPDL